MPNSAPQLRLEREVRRDVLLAILQVEPAGSGLAFEVDRDQQQRRVPRLVGGRRLVPFEEAHRQVEDADALLLLVGLGVVIDREEPCLEPLGSQAGLQPEVDVAGVGRLVVSRRLLGLGEER